jgi:CSLREA domain-containing protein
MAGYTPASMTRRRLWLAAMVAFGLVLVVLTGSLPAAQAGGDILVDTHLDEMTMNGKCSLREAVQAANTHATVDTCGGHSGANVIVLGAGTYALTIPKGGANDNTSGNLNLTSDITLGPLPCAGFCFSTIIQGGPGWNDQIIRVSNNAFVTLTGLTIQGGRSAQNGGGCRRTATRWC